MLRHFAAVVSVTAAVAAALAIAPPPARGPNTVAFDTTRLRFDNAELRQRFESFDAAARRFAGDGFAYRPYQLGGNFVTAVWAKGIGFTEPCTFRGPRESLKGIHRISVDTIIVPVEKARAKSAGLRVEVVSPDPDGWCLTFYYREATEQRVTGPGWSVAFYRWDPARYGIIPFRPFDEARERVAFPVYGHAVRDSRVTTPPPQPMKDDFVRHVRSAEGMRDAYLAELAATEKRVAAFIREHKARKRVLGKGPGCGAPPPPTHLEPLTPAEERAELEKAKQYFTAQAELMRKHHVAMYAVLNRAFPLDQCWPELAKPK